MKKTSLKILILSILLLLVVPCVANAATEIIVKQGKEYIIYSDSISGNNVSFAFSKTELENEGDLSNIESFAVRKDNSSDRYVAYINEETKENVNAEGNTYIYIKDLETNKVTKETINLKNALDKEYVESITKRIKVDTTKTETTTKTINGVKTEVTTGKIVITDESSPKYSYMIQVLPKEGTNEYKELMELAKQINAIANNKVEKEPSFMEKLELMNKFYTLYTALEPAAKDNSWLPVENMEIMQPNFDKAEDEKEYDNQQYIVFIKNEDGSIIDAQFMTCEAKYNPLYEKETVTIKETSKLPVTFDSLTTIIIIFAVIIVAIIIVLVLRKKADKKEENK